MQRLARATSLLATKSRSLFSLRPVVALALTFGTVAVVSGVAATPASAAASSWSDTISYSGSTANCGAFNSLALPATTSSITNLTVEGGGAGSGAREGSSTSGAGGFGGSISASTITLSGTVPAYLNSEVGCGGTGGAETTSSTSTQAGGSGGSGWGAGGAGGSASDSSNEPRLVVEAVAAAGPLCASTPRPGPIADLGQVRRPLLPSPRAVGAAAPPTGPPVAAGGSGGGAAGSGGIAATAGSASTGGTNNELYVTSGAAGQGSGGGGGTGGKTPQVAVVGVAPVVREPWGLTPEYWRHGREPVGTNTSGRRRRLRPGRRRAASTARPPPATGSAVTGSTGGSGGIVEPVTSSGTSNDEVEGGGGGGGGYTGGGGGSCDDFDPTTRRSSRGRRRRGSAVGQQHVCLEPDLHQRVVHGQHEYVLLAQLDERRGGSRSSLTPPDPATPGARETSRSR